MTQRIHQLLVQHPLVLNVLVCVFSWCVLGVDYQSNDDYVIASLISNAERNADAYVLFVNPMLTGVLQVLERVSGPVSVWGIFLVVCNLFAGVLLWRTLYRVINKSDDEIRSLILLLIWCVFMGRFYAVIQFTQTAFLVSFAGIAYCVWGQRKALGNYLLGSVLCIVGGMIRFDALCVCLLFFAGVLCFPSCLCESKDVWRKLVIAFLAILITGVAIFQAGAWAHREAFGWDVIAWNQARSAISDTTPIRSSADYEFEKYHVFENDLKMVQSFTHADLSVFSRDYLGRILKARDGEDVSQKFATRFEKALSLWRVGKLAELAVCWFFIIVCATLTFCSKNRKCGWGVLALLLGLLSMLASIERLYPRVVYPLVFLACLVLLAIGDGSRVSEKFKQWLRWCLLGGLGVCLMIGLGLEGAWSSAREGPERMNGGTELARFIESHSDNIFCIQQIDLTIDRLATSHSLFSDAPVSTLPHVLSLGGWHFHLKTQSLKRKNLSWEGIKSLCNENVFVVCLSSGTDRYLNDREYLGMLCKHLELHEGMRAFPSLEAEIQGVRFYRLVGKKIPLEEIFLQGD